MRDVPAGGAVPADKAHDANTLWARYGRRGINPSHRPAGSPSPRGGALRGSQRDRAMVQSPEALPAALPYAMSGEHSRPRLRSPRSRDDMDHPIFDPPWTVWGTIPSALPAQGYAIGAEISQVFDLAGKRRCLPALCRPASHSEAVGTAISRPRSPCAVRPGSPARFAMRLPWPGLARHGWGGAEARARSCRALVCQFQAVRGRTRDRRGLSGQCSPPAAFAKERSRFQW